MMVYYILFIQEIKDIILSSMEVLDLETHQIGALAK